MLKPRFGSIVCDDYYVPNDHFINYGKKKNCAEKICCGHLRVEENVLIKKISIQIEALHDGSNRLYAVREVINE